MKIPQRKVDKKRSITILPRLGIMERAPEKIRAESPYTQIRAPAHIRAKANLVEARRISPAPERAERGE